MKQLLILSGKGGTGKTTIASAFIKLAEARLYADCDVDAPNLHLIMNPGGEPVKRDYYGLDRAFIDQDKCNHCDLCRQSCRFDAIRLNGDYTVDPFLCEGCGVCEFVCPIDCISMKDYIDGELKLYRSEDEVFSTAQLKIGSGTSGLLVTEVKKEMLLSGQLSKLAIIDGSPGIGCPVIASLSGVDMVVIVAEPSISGISDMKRIIKTAKTFGVEIGVCINKFDQNFEKTREIEDFCNEKGLSFLGKIPYDSQVIMAINSGKTIVDIDCESGKAVKDIYNKSMELLFRQ